jgi:hypothetical protein
MSWVSEMASVMGIPAGAATLAGAMYGACAAAEKTARPEALRDIGRILKDPSWSRSVRPSAIIERVFVWTFGDRHLSWRCVGASAITTILIFVWASLTLFGAFQTYTLSFFAEKPFVMAGFFACTAFLPDYVALAKTRLFMQAAFKLHGFSLILLPVTDVVLSIAISFVCLVAYDEVYQILYGGGIADIVHDVWQDSSIIYDSLLGNSFFIYDIAIVSTAFTSIWTVLILFSTTAIKMLSPVHRLTSWFFSLMTIRCGQLESWQEDWS